MNAKQPLNQQGREAYSGQIKNFSKERYISTDWSAREWQAVWAKSWIAAVHVSDLTDPGDYVVFDLGPESCLLTCDGTGTVDTSPGISEEAELVARAKALLADYDPQPARQKPSNFEYGQLVNARRRRADAIRGARAIGR